MSAPVRPEPATQPRIFGRLAELATEFAGSTGAFILAAAVVIIWIATGPLFHFSNTWQLVINTGTTIVTFLMVFLIQRAQNKDSLAMQLKLNEIVAALEGASNALIGVEAADEQQLRTLREHYKTLATMAQGERRLTESHSVEEAKARHAHKIERRRHKRTTQ